MFTPTGTASVWVNVFTVAASWHGLKLMDVFRGVTPFVLAMIVTAFLVFSFPWIATGLPDYTR